MTFGKKKILLLNNVKRHISLKTIAIHVLCWTLLKGYELIFYTSGSSFDYAYRNAFSRFPAEVILYYAGVAFILPSYFRNRNARQLVVRMLMALVVATFAYRLGRYFLFPLARIENDFLKTLFHIPSFFVAPFYYISIPALGFIFYIFNKLRDQDDQKKEADRQRILAEVKLLKAQIQPHFLFNTLNNIYGLALGSSGHTADSILRLSKIMEYLLYHSGGEYVALGLEMQYIRDYIELEKLRYGSRLQVSWDVDESLNDRQVAPLLFFPFIENAFKHGSAKADGDIYISVSLRMEDGLLVYRVVNSIGAIDNTSPVESNGSGLQNLNKRLEFSYPGKFSIDTAQGESSFMSVLNIDWR